MRSFIKNYNVFHGIQDKLIFSLGETIAFIVLFVVANLKLDPAFLIVASSFMMFAEMMRDYFLFGGIYSRSRKSGILRCSFYGEKVYVGGIMQDLLRSFLHYAFLLGANILIKFIVDGTVTKRYALAFMTFAFLFYFVTAAALNVLRYVVNFNFYPSVVSLFILPGVISTAFIYIFGIDKKSLSLEPCLIVAIVLSIVITFITYKHTKASYARSIYGKDNK